MVVVALVVMLVAMERRFTGPSRHRVSGDTGSTGGGGGYDGMMVLVVVVVIAGG